jgi:hypothetical protein
MNTTEKQQTRNWDTDRDYTEGKVAKITPLFGAGWLATVESEPWLGKRAKAHMLIPGHECSQEPAVGETARIYGPNERKVRGLVIEGRVYCYITAAEADEAEAELELARQKERQTTLDEERETRDARRALLPSPFRARLDAFEARGGERWRRDVEGFELDVLEVAARVAALNPSIEGFYKFDDLPHPEQVKRVCGGGGTTLTDNAFQYAIGMAGFTITGTVELLPFLHSAACPEGLGCEICACPSMSPSLLDGADYALAKEALVAMLTARKLAGDMRAKEPAEAVTELDGNVRKVRPHNGGGAGMSPPRTAEIELLFAGLERATGGRG